MTFSPIILLGHVAHSGLVQVYSLVPVVHGQLFGLVLWCGESTVEEIDSVDRCDINT